MFRILLQIFYTVCLILFIGVTALVINRQLQIFTLGEEYDSAVSVATSTGYVQNEKLMESIDKSINIVEDGVVSVVESVVGEKSTKVETILVEEDPMTEVEKVANVAETPMPGPFTLFSATEGELSVGGVVLYTNTERFENGLAQLVPNTELHLAAVAKIDEMIANQYFEHVSPLTGNDVSDLALQVGYEYILVGENLAMGDFEDDRDLVNGWMNSPGHRANILNERFMEIGVATKRGVLDGRETWFAVQIFGRPLSLCSAPSQYLSNTISTTQTEVDAMSQTMEELQTQIEGISNKYSNTYKELVSEYNGAIAIYNPLVGDLRDMIETYNEQVRDYNICLAE